MKNKLLLLSFCMVAFFLVNHAYGQSASFSNCSIEKTSDMIKCHFDLNVKGLNGNSVEILARVYEDGNNPHKNKRGDEIRCEATYQISSNNANLKNKCLNIPLKDFNPLPGDQSYYVMIYAYHGTEKYLIEQGPYLSFDLSGNSKPKANPKSWSKIKQGTTDISSGISAIQSICAKDKKMANGTNIEICGSLRDEQEWYFESAGDGSYYICSAINHDYVLDVKKGVAADGTNVQLYKRNNTLAQRWFFEKCHTSPDSKKDDHIAYIIHSALDTSLVLTVDNKYANSGSNILIKTNYGKLTQMWRLDGL